MLKRQAVCVLLRDTSPEGLPLVLGVSRKHNLFVFGLPGGKVEDGETLEEAAARETREETGLIVTNLKNIFKRSTASFEVFTFSADWFGVLNPSPGESSAAWLVPEELAAGPFGTYNAKLLTLVGLYDASNPRCRKCHHKLSYHIGNCNLCDCKDYIDLSRNRCSACGSFEGSYCTCQY